MSMWMNACKIRIDGEKNKICLKIYIKKIQRKIQASLVIFQRSHNSINNQPSVYTSKFFKRHKNKGENYIFPNKIKTRINMYLKIHIK